MRKYQKGEVTLLVIVMVGMMVWMVSGQMGMGHSDGYAEKSADTAQQTKVEPAAFAVPASPEPLH